MARGLVAAAGAGLVATVVIAGAAASPSTKNFTASFAPGPGAHTYTFTLTNHTSSLQDLGSSNVTIPPQLTPAAVSVAAPTASAGKSWTSKRNANVIELRARNAQNALAAGQSVTVLITAASACGTTWQTAVKQSNNFLGTGNDFFLVDASGQPTTVQPTIAGTGVATVAIGTIASPQEAGAPFSATVTATDPCGNPGTGSVSLELLPGGNAGQLSGTTTQTLNAGGQATFADLVIDKSGPGYKLRATWNGVTGESNAFDVVDKICVAGEPCFATDGFGTTFSAPAPPSGASLAISFSGRGGQSLCGTHDLSGSRVTVDPRGYTAPSEITIVWPNALPPGVGVPHYILCWQDDKPGSEPEVMPKCASQNPVPTCELHRSRTGVADFRAVILLAPNDPNFDFG